MPSLNGPRLAVGLIAVVLGLEACQWETDAPSAPTTAQPITPQASLDVQFVSSTPPAGATLELASPNDTPVALSVTFSVTVPSSLAGDYFWTTAVQADNPPGFSAPVVTTSPLQLVSLGAGTQNVTLQTFHTTNAVCAAGIGVPRMSTSLDIEIKTQASYVARPFFGKVFPVVFGLRCR